MCRLKPDVSVYCCVLSRKSTETEYRAKPLVIAEFFTLFFLHHVREEVDPIIRSSVSLYFYQCYIKVDSL